MTYTGTISTGGSASLSVTGTGTAFTTQLKVGQRLGQSWISKINSDTSLDLATPSTIAVGTPLLVEVSH